MAGVVVDGKLFSIYPNGVMAEMIRDYLIVNGGKNVEVKNVIEDNSLKFWRVCDTREGYEVRELSNVGINDGNAFVAKNKEEALMRYLSKERE